MAWAHPDVLDNGLTHLRLNATRLLLVSTYTNGDSYETVTSRKLAEVSLTPADWTISDDDGGGRKITSVPGKIVTATGSAAGPVAPAQKIDLFWAFTSTSGKVLFVTAATSTQAIVADKAYIFPPLTYFAHQPTPSAQVAADNVLG